MFLIILGMLIVVVSFFLVNGNNPLARFKGAIRIVGFVIVILGALTSMLKVIDAGDVGVKTLYGKVDEGVLHSGLNVVNPLVEVTTFDIRTQNYTMSAVHNEGNKDGDDAIRVLSADGLEVVIDLSVLFRLNLTLLQKSFLPSG